MRAAGEGASVHEYNCHPFCKARGAADPPLRPGLALRHLALAGAHHRTGSEMLTRIMGALCKRCVHDGRGRRVALTRTRTRTRRRRRTWSSSTAT